MSKAQTSTRGNEIKRKQLLLLGGAVAIFTVVALGATYLFTKDAPKREAPAKPPEQISLVTGGSAYSEKEAWRTQLGSDVANMQKQFQEFTRQQQERDRERDEANKKAAAAGRDVSPPVRPGATPPEGSGQNGASTAAVTTPPPPLDLPPPPKRPKGNGTGPIVQGGGAFDPPAGSLGGAGEKSAIGSVSFDDPKKSGAGQNVDGESGGMFEKQAGQLHHCRVVRKSGAAERSRRSNGWPSAIESQPCASAPDRAGDAAQRIQGRFEGLRDHRQRYGCD